MFNKHFDYHLEDTNEAWFEHSNIGFKDNIDDRPLFDQYNSTISSSWHGPKFRLKREVHDLFYKSFTNYRISQVIDPLTFHPFIRCDIDNVDDDSLLVLKLTWNIIIQDHDTPIL